MLLLAGSVFIYSPFHWELSEMLRSYWTQFGVLLMVAWYGFCYLRKKAVGFSLSGFWWAFFTIGTLESLYILLQIMHLVSMRSHTFLFSGSFLNPAIAAMLLSLCIPVGLWLLYNETDKRIRWVLAAICLSMATLLLLSASRTGLLAAMVASCLVIGQCSGKIKALLRRTNKTLLCAVALFSLVLACFALYHLRTDSADGRILIWKVALDMVTEHPFWGYGPNGFDAHYMQWQAEYLTNHPDSPHILLADNVAVPFNEFLGIAINYGLTGICLVFALIGLTAWLLFRRITDRGLLMGMTGALIVWSMFSYIYNQPFVWVLTVVIITAALSTLMPKRNIGRFSAIVILCLSVAAIAYKATKFCCRIDWHIVQDSSLRGHTMELMPQYAKLYSHLNDDSGFLYNYGAELHYIGRYDESLKILKECVPLYNDYNVQMLLADDFAKIGMSDSAIFHYRFAARMVPCKFLPLYQEMQMHLDYRDTIAAKKVALEILHKPVKIKDSSSVQSILAAARDVTNL